MRLIKMGGPELANEILDRFLREAPKKLELSHVCLDGGDFASLAHHLHRICSDAGWLGAAEVQSLASQLELDSRDLNSQDIIDFRQRLERLSELCYAACVQLDQERVSIRSDEMEAPNVLRKAAELR